MNGVKSRSTTTTYAQVVSEDHDEPEIPQKEDKLAGQYGGNSRTGWVGLLPSSWVPFVQLARLSPPAGLFLIYFPHLFGVLHGAIVRGASAEDTLRAAAITFVGSFFVSNAIHIWNDLIDAPLDAKVERTKNRPIPRGAVSPKAALIFTFTQAIGAAVFLPLVSPSSDGFQAALHALPSIIVWTYYPWAKCHTNNPQAVLGFCLAWGIVIGSLAVGVESFSLGSTTTNKKTPNIGLSGVFLILASILWTMIYDTIYAHQDLKDDLKAGIKSLAVLYRDRTKVLLWRLLVAMTILLMATGYLERMSPVYYLLAAGGAFSSLGLMIAKVDLSSTESCWWWFGNGFWFAGGALATGLFAEYVLMHWH